jgi:hypothetical protein
MSRSTGTCTSLAALDLFSCRTSCARMWLLLRVHWRTSVCPLPSRFGVDRASRHSFPNYGVPVFCHSQLTQEVYRLAFADLLRENGQPAAVLLDDAIVFADDDRFTRRIHILRKAAEKTQILIFTCRERDYLAAGTPILRLADCCA